MISLHTLRKLRHRAKCMINNFTLFTRNAIKSKITRFCKTSNMLTTQYILKTKSFIIRMNRDDKLCWYHRSLTREEADKLLLNSGVRDGVFLVRDSNTSPGDYVLSVLHKDEVFHYQIRRHGDDAFFSIDDQPPIHGLDSLIEHYQNSSDGLVTQLSTIITNEPPPAESRRHGRSNLLHRSTKNGNLLVVEELLDSMSNNPGNKYQLDAKDQDGRSAVHLACFLDNNAEAILEKLINANANVNCRDEEGNTPLHYACRNKPVSLVKMLVDANAYIDARNNDTGRVPLHEAAAHGNLEAVKLLLDLGVAHLPRCAMGQTPVQFARDAGHIETAEYLEKYKPPPPTVHSSQWYHGTLSRTESTKMLRKYATVNRENQDASGTFLVRHSMREKTYILGLLIDDNELKNYVIKRNVHKQLYIDEGPYMLSLEHLVQHYMRFSDGLPTKLRFPVPPMPKPPLPPTAPPVPLQQLQVQTLPKSTNFFKKLCSPSGQTQDDSSKPRKFSKDTDSLSAMPESKERNLSLPSDDLMNQVGLCNAMLANINDTTLPLTTKPKKSPRKSSTDILIFGNSLGRKGRDIIGSMKLSKSSKSKLKEPQESTENATNNLIPFDNISKSLKNLTFSSDINDGTIYKVPSNLPLARPDDIQNQNVLPSSMPPSDRPSFKQNKTNIDDLELFTQSDKHLDAIDIETQDRDNAIEEIYFVEAPIKAVPISTVPLHNYVAFRQIPYFPPANTANEVQDTLNCNVDSYNNVSTANRAPANPSVPRVDRVQSVDSTFSNYFDMIFKDFQNPADPNRSTANSPTDGSKTSPNYYIPAAGIQLNEVLGAGEFGSVWKGCMKCESQNGESQEIPIAVKTLHDEHGRENRIEFLREASVMIKLSHHCIVKMIGISKGPPLMIIQELVSFGSLLDYLTQNSDTINPKSELKIWASQIACGMHYLQTQHFVHRDLAARNILLSSRHQAKISDFGLSRALCAGNNYYQTSRGGKWPIKWYAPESCNFGIFSHASDVWSFGVTLWEMYSFGEPPYGSMRGADVIPLVESGRRLSQPDACPDNVFDIMSSCWNYDPKHRPTFRYLTEFFSNDPDYQNVIELFKSGPE